MERWPDHWPSIRWLSTTHEPLDWNLYRNELRGDSFLVSRGERASEVRPLRSHLRDSRSEGHRPICRCRAPIGDLQRCRCIPDGRFAPNRSSFVSIGVGDCRAYAVAVDDARDNAAIQYVGDRRGVVSVRVHQTSISSIVGGVDLDNPASARVLQKNGFHVSHEDAVVQDEQIYRLRVR